MLPLILLLSVLSRWSGGLVDRFGARVPLVIGPASPPAAFAPCRSRRRRQLLGHVLSGHAVLGLGMSVSVAPLTTTVMNSVDASFSGAASGINIAASRVAALFAVALFGLIMASIFNGRLHGELERAAVTPNLIEAIEQQRNKLAAIDAARRRRCSRTGIGEKRNRRGVRRRVSRDHADFGSACAGQRSQRMAADRRCAPAGARRSRTRRPVI